MDKPLRHLEATFKISADDVETFIGHLRQVAFDLDRSSFGENGYYSVSGGYSSSHTIEVKVNKDITHDSWAKQLDEYLAEMKAEKQAHIEQVAVTPEAKQELIETKGLTEDDFETVTICDRCGKQFFWSGHFDLCAGCVDELDDGDYEDYTDRTCPECNGSGGDRWNDGIVPCKLCQGAGYIG